MSIIEIIMAFDFGTKKIGVAIGQSLTCTTQSIGVFQSKSGTPNWSNIEYIYNEWKPTTLIVGLPLQYNGEEQHISILAKKFAVQLKNRFNTAVHMHDERFTTIEARLKKIAHQYGNSKKNKRKIDSISAEIILQSWLYKNYIVYEKSITIYNHTK